MAYTLNIWFLVTTLPFLANLEQLFVFCEPQVPCFFIFGDSLVDNGNNNDLETTAKANYAPYGIDFPDGPTGRFCNGRNMADIIAKLLGFEKYIPPFATATENEILMGVNYGSGGAGIRDETGSQLGARISLNNQLLNHQTTVSQIVLLLGSEEAAANYLSKCIYYVGMGSNDYINNYLQSQYYPTSLLYTPEEYAAVLIQQYSQQLKTLYKYGARNIALPGLGLIGCTPDEMATYGTNGSTCVDTIDKDVALFNAGLYSLVDDLNNNLTDAKFIYINTTQISSGDSSDVGITVTNESCCVASSNMGKGQCVPNLIPCSDRDEYSFWDGFHPTEIANLLVGTGVYDALTPLLSAPKFRSDEGIYELVSAPKFRSDEGIYVS